MEPDDGSSKFDVHTVQKQVETFYIGDDFLPEPPEAPPAAEDSMSSFAYFEDDLLPEPPEAPPELQDRTGLVVLAGPGPKAGAESGHRGETTCKQIQADCLADGGLVGFEVCATDVDRSGCGWGVGHQVPIPGAESGHQGEATCKQKEADHLAYEGLVGFEEFASDSIEVPLLSFGIPPLRSELGRWAQWHVRWDAYNGLDAFLGCGSLDDAEERFPLVHPALTSWMKKDWSLDTRR